MRSKILPAFMVSLLFIPVTAFSKGRRSPAPVQTPIEKRNERLLQLINVNIILTDNQKNVIVAALDNQNQKSAEIQKRFENDQKALGEQTDQAINAVLNDEQKVTYARAKEALQNEEAKKARQQQRLEASGDHSESRPNSERRERP